MKLIIYINHFFPNNVITLKGAHNKPTTNHHRKMTIRKDLYAGLRKNASLQTIAQHANQGVWSSLKEYDTFLNRQRELEQTGKHVDSELRHLVSDLWRRASEARNLAKHLCRVAGVEFYETRKEYLAANPED